MAKLEILGGPDAGRTYEVGSGRLIVGRGEECDVRINEGSISRHHAALECLDGVWFVEDLESANGVFIKGEQIRRCVVSGRTPIQFGSIGTLFDATYNGESLSITAEASTASAAADAAAVKGAPAARPDGTWMQGQALGKEAITDIHEMGAIYGQIAAEFGRTIVGQKRVLEELLVAIAAGGHCLMIGLPGLGKTLMVNFPRSTPCPRYQPQ